MPQATEGDFVYRGGRFALIVARFNDTITGRMLEGALDTLRRSGVDMDKDGGGTIGLDEMKEGPQGARGSAVGAT